MSRPYAGMGVAAAGSAAAFWATDLYASNLASLPGEAVTNLSAALSTLPSYIASHGPLPTAAPLALACGLAAGCGVWVAWANMVARRGNYRSGEEHGSARWATPRELRRLSDEASPDDNILLTQGVRLAMSRDDHDPRWERNRNVVVIGGSGSGKTRTYVEPNLMQMNASYLVTDPKGTTVRRLGAMLAAHGYDVRTLNTVDFSLSMRYNPLAYVRTQQDVLELVECLIVNTTPKGKSANDPFWENSERLLYCALIGYLTYHCPPEDRTLPGLMTLLSLAEARDEDESFMSPLDVLFRELETGRRCVAAPGGAGGDGRSMGGAGERVRWVPWCDPATPDSDYALGRYRAFKAAAGKTLKSIIISCNARLSALASEELRDILSADDMRLDTLGDPGQRAAIFATTSDTNATYSFLLAMLMWQAGNVLCERALTAYGGELPTPVHLVLDEFAALPQHRRLGRAAVARPAQERLRRRRGDHPRLLRHDPLPGRKVRLHEQGDLGGRRQGDRLHPHPQRDPGRVPGLLLQLPDHRARPHPGRGGGKARPTPRHRAHRRRGPRVRPEVRARAPPPARGARRGAGRPGARRGEAIAMK